MTSTLLLTIFIASIQAAPAPSPAPSLPPEIIHTVTSETCTTLQKLMLPVGFDLKNNDQAFGSMAAETKKYLNHIMVGDDNPQIQRPNVDGGNTSGMSTTHMSKTISADNGVGSATSASASSSRQDDPVGYGPEQTMEAARIDRAAQAIYKNATAERKLLQDSYAEYPPGKNAQLDTLRQQTSDLIESQSALADRYENFASTYLSNLDNAQIVANSARDEANFKDNLRALLLGSTYGLDANAEKAPANDYGFHDVKTLAKNGTTPEVLGALRYHQNQFSSSLVDLYNQCHGTHYVVPTPAPSGHKM